MLLNDAERYIRYKKDTKCFKSIEKVVMSNREYKLLYRYMGRCRKKNNGNSKIINYIISDNQFDFWSNLEGRKYSSNLHSDVGNRTTGKQLYKNIVAEERLRTNWD